MPTGAPRASSEFAGRNSLGVVDLHLHSTASDGRLRPAALVQKAAGAGLQVIALADHDTVSGIPEALDAARAFYPLKVIPCVEISTDVAGGEVHILGYYLDYEDAALEARLAHFRVSREGRAEKMVAKLADLGMVLDWQRVKEIAGTGSIGRPHVAQAMLEKGYVPSLRDAFQRYIGQGGPAYVEREKMTPVEAVALVLSARGLPVLAHPFTVHDPQSTVAELVPAGLVGLEAYYANSTAEQVNRLLRLARRFDILVTGGSDFHGLDDGSEIPLGSLDVPASAAADLTTLARKRKPNCDL